MQPTLSVSPPRRGDWNPYVAGEFVWNGFDYLGEPTPYYDSRSSYSGMIDLAGHAQAHHGAAVESPVEHDDTAASGVSTGDF